MASYYHSWMDRKHDGAEYFDQLCTADTQREQLRVDGLHAADADSPIDEVPPSFDWVYKKGYGKVERWKGS